MRPYQLMALLCLIGCHSARPPRSSTAIPTSACPPEWSSSSDSSAGTTAIPEATSEEAGLGARECPERFAQALRGRWLELGGERYHVDAMGRPDRAVTVFPPIEAEDRIAACQDEVGRWGDAMDPANDYDGGHLIGSQLGGWGGRANIVPQVVSFNRGNWVQLENAVASCEGRLDPGRLEYEITVEYPDDGALIPRVVRMRLRDTRSCASITLQFENARHGGPDGTATRERGVQWLRALGCGR